MNAGKRPEPGASRMTIVTYRIGPDGEHTMPSKRITVTADPDPERLATPLTWPACQCPRCRTGNGPRAR
ncbi:hypothetical protein C4B68_12055 [Streptomyces dengpaensis]|uniref:Uncharacterized protein n=1 Tax=Streptomyces dengpaensis TaxID=2049881 RepID=A0ABM6SP62_9ACTN|nr:hypothetical protein C4B68_12055 [Streptomyces dengpaensis]PIB05722.1 hypothetical protein B1C81_28230 [Streptomyces sp. HG99]